MRGTKLFLLLLLFLFCATCTEPKHHNVARGFYYWKTIYNPTAFERGKLHQMGVQKIYLRLFDVDQDAGAQEAVPVGVVRIKDADTTFKHVPVVFITQKALALLNDATIKTMARNICHLADVLCGQAGIMPGELQIDCDWTSNNKEKYFFLLRTIRQQPWMKGKELSCTIRLHQVKYRAGSGIPPVDRGVVMCYAMGDLKKPGAHNSILDAGGARDYLQHIDAYPVSLDIALPLFEWCVLFRAKEFKGILHDIQADMVKNSPLFKQQEDNLYIAQQDSMWQGYEFKTGDIVRLEQPAYKDVLDVAGYSAKRIRNADMNVIFFDCDSITLKKFSTDGLETIYKRYR